MQVASVGFPLAVLASSFNGLARAHDFSQKEDNGFVEPLEDDPSEDEELVDFLSLSPFGFFLFFFSGSAKPLLHTFLCLFAAW